MEGDSVLSKILPGNAAEQAGKLGEGGYRLKPPGSRATTGGGWLVGGLGKAKYSSRKVQYLIFLSDRRNTERDTSYISYKKKCIIDDDS